ncbi:MAG: aspartate dehydrogenase [Lachnospiraceae bacterium]|nr:aspartate dehydrogenase [Lachnospiraceae bacterium]
MLFKKKKSEPVIEFDRETQQAILKCSICTGEQVAGFKDRQTGHFTEVMLIRNEKDLDRFKEQYQLSEVAKEY